MTQRKILNKMMALKYFSLVFVSLVGIPVIAQSAMETPAVHASGSSLNLALGILAVFLALGILAMAGALRLLTRNRDQWLKILKLAEKDSVKTLVLLGFLTLPFKLAAQGTSALSEFPKFLTDPNTVLLLILDGFLLLAFLYVAHVLRKTINVLIPAPKRDLEVKSIPAAAKLSKALTGTVPLSQEHEIMMDHEYDGIRELDNDLPPWWVWLFNLSIVFSVVYLVYYHVLPFGVLQEEEYHNELAEAEIQIQAYLAQAKDLVDENTVTFLSSAADLAAGKTIYMANCLACHAADGGGGVGPNFTDDYWLHGGSINDIYRIVRYGVPTKGMIAWESQLKPVQMAQVSSFIKTLQGTVPLNPKEPQGDLWVESAEADSTATAVDVEAIPEAP